MSVLILHHSNAEDAEREERDRKRALVRLTLRAMDAIRAQHTKSIVWEHLAIHRKGARQILEQLADDAPQQVADLLAHGMVELVDAPEESELPTPWRFEWPDDEPPRIFASNGRVVCVVTFGTLDRPYPRDIIQSVGRRIAAAGARP